MKALVFKLRKYARIFRANIVNTFQTETAYFGNNWGNLISTICYTLVLVLFIDVLYSRLPNFAGYSKNEMFFLVFIAQIGFYLTWSLSEMGHRQLIEDIRRGTLDFLLVLPVSSLWMASTRKILLLSAVRDGLPTLTFLGFLVHWSALPLTWTNLFFAGLIFIFGQVAWSSFSFLLVLPVFWQGESSQFYSWGYILHENNNVPWEGYTNQFKFILSAIVPTLICSVLPASVALGKSPPVMMFLMTFLIALFFWSLKVTLWRVALKNYTSAS